MAKLLLLPANAQQDDWDSYPAWRIFESHAVDRHRVHDLTTDADEADVILVAKNTSEPPLNLGYWSDPLFTKYWRKTVVYDGGDNPSPFIGGLCPSWPVAFQREPEVGLGWCYFHPASAEPLLDCQSWMPRPPLLWSFVGSKNTHTIRTRLFELADPESFVKDTSGKALEHLSGSSDRSQRQKFHQEFTELLQQSEFVVCPRGAGAASMRIFEAMRAGRAPVIISDEWTPPPFVDWDACSLRIAEKQVSQLPQFLRSHRCHARRLGLSARQEWLKVFSDEGLFHHTVEASMVILRERPNNVLVWQALNPRSKMRTANVRIVISYFMRKFKRPHEKFKP